MSFKTKNLEESSIMRSFAKKAVETGLVKLDPIVKKSSNNYCSTNDLSCDIMKLIAGLKEIGKVKYAEELEENFIRFKKAETRYYNSMKEDGDDLINYAHPTSYFAKGKEENSKVETIVEIKKKILDSLNKKPTGKL